MKILKKENIKAIADAFRAGKVIALPTDTVYGLFCDACNKSAVKKIFAIKSRPADKPIGIFVKDMAMARQCAGINSKQEVFLEDYWPGRVTFILRNKTPFSEGVGAKDTIGIRIPDYSLFKEIFKAIGFPLAQTSANLSGRPCIVSAKEVMRQFKNRASRPDLILDAGNLPLSEPSAVVDLTGDVAKVLRKGEVDFLVKKD